MRSARLSEAERLHLQQLRLEEWAERGSGDDQGAWMGRDSMGNGDDLPPRWQLTRGLTLAHWQEEARDAWFAAGRHGTIKVVTGAGKTVVALAIAERLQRVDPELRVTIVVPTIVLMNQWFETFQSRSNLPASA